MTFRKLLRNICGGDPIGDHKCEHVQFGGSWCFCASGLGWRIDREEPSLRRDCRITCFLFLCRFCPACQFLCPYFGARSNTCIRGPHPPQYLLDKDMLFWVDPNLATNRINRRVLIYFKSVKNQCFCVYLCDGICTEIINTWQYFWVPFWPGGSLCFVFTLDCAGQY